VYLFTISMLCHAEVTFIQLLNLFKMYYVYLHYIFEMYYVYLHYIFAESI